MPGSPRLLCIATMVAFVAGCSSMPRPQAAPLPVVAPATDFTIAAGMLDTWNAIGQILVHVDGLTYEGRSQMLGLYDVQYRDERFMILTRALVLTSAGQAITTKVSAVLRDGKPDSHAPAIEVLGLLQARLPDEFALIKADAAKASAAKASHPQPRKRIRRHKSVPRVK